MSGMMGIVLLERISLGNLYILLQTSAQFPNMIENIYFSEFESGINNSVFKLQIENNNERATSDYTYNSSWTK